MQAEQSHAKEDAHAGNESPGSNDLADEDIMAKEKAGGGNDADEKMHWDARQLIAIGSLCILWVGSQLPLYFMGATLQYAAEDIGGKALTQMSWLPTSNTLALASVCPFSGYMTDLVGRRMITLIGAAAIIIGIIIVGTAHSFEQAVAGMAIAGAGAGVGELVALSGVAELVPVRKRGLYIGCIVAVLAPTTPYVIYGQLLATRTEQGWRWGQWISLIYNGVAFLGILACYFPERAIVIERPSKLETLKKIDYIGAFLSIVGVALFLVALQSGGFTHPWSDAYVLAPLIIGICLMIAFVIWEWKGAKNPMVPRELFRGQRVVAITFCIVFIAGMNFYSLINFFPLSFQTLYSPDPVQVGLKGLGYGISVTLGAVVVDIGLTLLPKYNKELLLGSCVIMASFIGGLAAATPDNPKLNVALGTIAGFGVGGIIVPASTVAMTACPDNLIGTTVALSLAVRVIGGAIGYAIYYNIFTNKLMNALPTNIATAVGKAGLPQSEILDFIKVFTTTPTEVTTISGVTQGVIAAATRASQESYAYGLKYVWLTSIAFGCVAVIICLFLPSNQKFLTNRIAARIRS